MAARMNSPAPFGQTATKARFSLDEFVRIYESGALGDSRLELVDGEIERMSPAMGTHFGFQGDVFGALISAVGKRAVVEAGIDLGDATMLGCDVAVLHAPMRERRFLQPDEVLLAIEVADTTLDRDLGMKRHRYAEAGIAHYWVVDTHRSVVHVFSRPAEGDYAGLELVPFGSPLAVPGTDATITLT